MRTKKIRTEMHSEILKINWAQENPLKLLLALKTDTAKRGYDNESS